MRFLSVVCILILLAVTSVQAQTQAERPLVVFVEEPTTLQMSSVIDTGADGLTRLAEIFNEMGADTAWQRLREPLPPETSVIVLVRPRRMLTPVFMAYLWERMSQGTSLLLAIDPTGFAGTRADRPNTGFDQLLASDAGVSLGDGMLIEPWYTNQSFLEPASTFSLGFVDPVPSPLTDPVRQYDLSVGLWGARPLLVEPFGINNFGWSLVDANPAFVETETNIFPTRTADGEPPHLDIDSDMQGIVPVVGIGENTATNTRVALLGDAEFVQNGYGLAQASDTGTPQFAANYMITQRLAAWLLHLPDYPALPTEMTWIELDGEMRDWNPGLSITPDDTNDTSLMALDIQQVSAFRNDSYLYISIQTVAPASPDTQIDLDFDVRGNSQPDVLVSIAPDQVMAQDSDLEPVQVSDATMAVGSVIEIRLPLRIPGAAPTLIGLCLSSARELAFPQTPDCMNIPITIDRVGSADPAPQRDTIHQLVVVRGDERNRVNLRAAPNDESAVVTTVPFRTVFAVVGRSNSGNWLMVQDAARIGWISTSVLYPPGDIEAVPVVS
jgi:hypothetical protein